MIYWLLVIYQIKHFLADFPLQNRYMLGKFKPYPNFILPLLSHGVVHGLFTFGIALFFKPWQYALFLGLIDTTIHSFVDWLKANPSIGGRFVALSKKEMQNIFSYMSVLGTEELNKKFNSQFKSNTYFWWALGADQFAHHLTHYLLIWLVLS